ncbi:MAG: septum formation initiator family protein [Muribaculaceae bacterium]|jgi:cell division protein DivIC|nr:septum formation initiator family protein [Muribaculaceae bacterium]
MSISNKFNEIPTLHKRIFAVIVFFVFFFILIFYGDNSYVKTVEYSNKITELQTEIKANRDSAIIYQDKLNSLNTNKEELERIAREQYGMKRPNEDVYITDIK